MPKLGIVYLIIVNVFTFLAYGMDKRKAVMNKWRIPEKTLLLFAVTGGSIGALCGMYLFRHKTKKMTFVIGVPLILVLQIGIIIYFSLRL